jgi:hypothetical protein
MYKQNDTLVTKAKDYNKKSDLDHLYYNISIKNAQSQTLANYIPAYYSEQLSEPILVNGSNQYTMTVNRFSIPSSLIPIQIIPIKNNQPDPNNTIYSVTVVDSAGTTGQKSLEWVPETIYAGNVPLAPSLTPTKTQVVSPYYYLYDFNKFIEILNKAVDDALLLSFPSYTGYVPKFILNSDLTISLLTDDNFAEGTGTFSLYMNNALSQVISSFYVDYQAVGDPNGKDVLFRVFDLGNNRIQEPNADPTAYTYPPPIFRMTQEYSSLADFNNITRLIFTSNSLPIRSEFTPLAIPFGSTSDNFVNNPAPSYTSIVTDFALSSGNNGIDNLAGNLVYVASGNNCRMIDLISQNPIKSIDLQIYIVDTYDNVYPLLIPFANSINIKLEFRLKEANN